MSSVASSMIGAPNRVTYGADKEGVFGQTKAIAAVYAGSGMGCNAICLGTVKTSSLKARMSVQG